MNYDKLIAFANLIQDQHGRLQVRDRPQSESRQMHQRDTMLTR